MLVITRLPIAPDRSYIYVDVNRCILIDHSICRFSRFKLTVGSKHTLGSIRSQSTNTVNRDSSWIQYCGPDEALNDPAVMFKYRRVDYYTKVVVMGLELYLARVHYHPVDYEDARHPDRICRLIRIILSNELPERRAQRAVFLRRRGRALHNLALPQVPPVRPDGVQEPDDLSRRWTCVIIDKIKGLVGRIIGNIIDEERADYIVRPIDIFNPAVEFLDALQLHDHAEHEIEDNIYVMIRGPMAGGI